MSRAGVAARPQPHLRKPTPEDIRARRYEPKERVCLAHQHFGPTACRTKPDGKFMSTDPGNRYCSYCAVKSDNGLI